MIDTDALSLAYRKQAVDVGARKLLITNFSGTPQVEDMTLPPNCDGFGRIRHFRRIGTSGWPQNPLPIDVACRALLETPPDTFRAQVFQNAVCNWRCWYCFVPFDLLRANLSHSKMLSAGELLDLYLAEPNRPSMIDLTGGQPDLVPEWVPWMMRELRERGLEREVYLWSDDNLSNDYFWTCLSAEDRALVASYPMYGRVCCFKGFNQESFTFNTGAAPELFDRQFELFSRLWNHGIDMYAYVTLTVPHTTNLAAEVRRFVDRLQGIHPNLPLRTVPLEIVALKTVKARPQAQTVQHEAAILNQHEAIAAWQMELEARFTPEERARSIVDVPMRTAP